MSTTSTIRLIEAGISTPGVHQFHSGPTLVGLFSRLLHRLERRRQRDALADRVDDKRLLDDIGLTREQALCEASKPFWQ